MEEARKILLSIKPDVWFHCTLLEWVVRAGNCVECEYFKKPECPHPDQANNTEYPSNNGQEES